MTPQRLRWTVGGGLLLMLALTAAACWVWLQGDDTRAPISVGLIHAGSGASASVDASWAEATRRELAKLNAEGGLLGRPVRLVEHDTQGDTRRAAEGAERLIHTEGAVVLFGCGSAACREAVRPVVERARHLLFYPVAHEGLTASEHIVGTGPLPNQQVLPALSWALERFGPRVFVALEDDEEGRRLRVVLREFVRLRGAQWVGEAALAPPARDLDAVLSGLKRARPDVVVSLLRGPLHRQWVDQSVASNLAALPLLALRARGADLRSADGGRLRQQFTAWSYLAPKAAAGGLAADDESVAAALAVQLWAAAVRDARSVRTDAVQAHVLQQAVPAPQGVAAVDARSRHLWRALSIAQVGMDGGLDEVVRWPRYIRPEPWPTFRSVDEWRGLVPARREAP